MPRLDGVAATRAIKERYPSVEVVALTSFSEAERVHVALEAGAAGYLLKDAEADRSPPRCVPRREARFTSTPWWPASSPRTLVAPQGTATSLTPREREILVLVARGKSNRDIADALVISERTARTHVSHVLTKLGLTSRTQAALWAVREGLVREP
jgi:DNA-binding NarL/FixJ family response regulator